MALSAPRFAQLKGIKVALETTKGTKVAGTQALMVEEPKIMPTAEFIKRNGPGKYLGNNAAAVIGAESGTVTFKAELRGTGGGGLEAGLAILLQACGFKKTSETYNVHSVHTDQKTVSIDVWEDGVKKGLAGASGTFTLEGADGGSVLISFEFHGVWQAPVDEAFPAFSPSTTKPLLMKGGTFTIDSNSIKISKFSLAMNNLVGPRRDVDASSGIAYYLVSNRDEELGMDPEADLVAGYDYHGKWLAGTEAAVSLALTDGTDTVTITIPKAQYKELDPAERDGIDIYETTAQCNNTPSGDDSVTIAAS